MLHIFCAEAEILTKAMDAPPLLQPFLRPLVKQFVTTYSFTRMQFFTSPVSMLPPQIVHLLLISQPVVDFLIHQQNIMNIKLQENMHIINNYIQPQTPRTPFWPVSDSTPWFTAPSDSYVAGVSSSSPGVMLHGWRLVAVAFGRQHQCRSGPWPVTRVIFP